MPAAVESGLPGVRLESGDHICGFFFGVAERDDVLLLYLRAGLQSGEKCMCIVDATEPEHVTRDRETKPYVESEQLGVISASQAYLRTREFRAQPFRSAVLAERLLLVRPRTVRRRHDRRRAPHPPEILLGGMVLENPNYLSPDEFRASRS
jgi:MEDS: MEthanogen/methylotroph, DcmR Sensory domain